MKKQLLSLATFFALGYLFAQNGSADPSFNSNGKIDADYSTANSICVDKDMKTLVLGHDNSTGNRNIFVHRYKVDGSLDNSFGTAGRFLNDLNSDWDFGRCIKALPDGKYLISGQNSVGPYYRAYVMRIKNNGSVDSSFAVNGVRIISPSQGNCDAWSFEVAGSGSIYISGYRTVNSVLKAAVWKLKANGNVDSTFGTNGEKIISTNSYEEKLYGIDIQESSNTIAVTGNSNNVSTPEGLVAVLDTAGNLKTAFNSVGYKKIKWGGNPTNLFDVLLNSSSDVIVCGRYVYSLNSKALICSFTSTGAANTSFGNNGFINDSLSTISQYVQIVQDCKGDLYIGGNVFVSTALSFRLSKYTFAGKVDSSFAVNGHYTLRFRSSFDETIEALALYGDSGLVFGGRTNINGGTTRSGIARIKVDKCSNSTSITEQFYRSNYVLYPNPSASGTALNLQNSEDKEMKISVLSADGKLVYSGSKSLGEEEVLPASFSLSPGIYQLLITVAQKIESLTFVVE
jgi:uncharacterized delta-60 repeat protein